VGGQVEKLTSDRAFAEDAARQKDLINLSHRLAILPRITRVDGPLILMEFVAGTEGLTPQNAYRVGASLRLLHSQSGFTHSCLTGVDWLTDMANSNFGRAGCSTRVSTELGRHYQNDALIHAEPTQVIESNDGRIVFIDIEGIGCGSRYQDLGFIEYTTRLSESPGVLASFMKGYMSAPIELDAWRIRQMAGLIAIAYACFADVEKRLALGIQLLEEAEQHLTGDAFQRA
jgi:hypothetical protein